MKKIKKKIIYIVLGVISILIISLLLSNYFTKNQEKTPKFLKSYSGYYTKGFKYSNKNSNNTVTNKGAYINNKSFKDYTSFVNQTEKKINSKDIHEDILLAYQEILEPSINNKYSSATNYKELAKNDLKNLNIILNNKDKKEFYNRYKFNESFKLFLDDILPVNQKEIHSVSLTKDNYYVAYVETTKEEFNDYNKIAKNPTNKKLKKFGFTITNVNAFTLNKKHFNIFSYLQKQKPRNIYYMKMNSNQKRIVIILNKNKVSNDIIKARIQKSKFDAKYHDKDQIKNLELLLKNAQNTTQNFALSDTFVTEFYKELDTVDIITKPYLNMPTAYLNELLSKPIEN